MYHGNRYLTVSPPNTPCAMTSATFDQAKTLNHERRSTTCVQIAKMTVNTPATSAIMRWLCSYCTPPVIGGILYSDPKLVGQSGTDNPASLLVTIAPATINTNTHTAIN